MVKPPGAGRPGPPGPPPSSSEKSSIIPPLVFQARAGRRGPRPDLPAARAPEPSLAPVFRHAVFWELAASISNRSR
jgi:hypothetical protein